MTTFGVDYAWGRPGVGALRSAGVTFVCRYLSHDTTGKNLTPAEAQQLTTAGLWLLVVWEDGARAALGGSNAGVTDAKAALTQAEACGLPASRPIYFAVDFDITGELAPSTVIDYFRGVSSVLGVQRTGIYGGYSAVSSVMISRYAAYGWQTYAWSGGSWYDKAQLQQYSNDHTIGGVGCDYNRAITADYGQWQVGRSPDTGIATDEDVDVSHTGQLTTGQGAITPISWPQGKCNTIGFFADTGLAGAKPVTLRVAYQTAPGKFTVVNTTVDSSKGKTVVSFGAAAKSVDAVSVQRQDAGTVTVCWDAS